MNIVSRYVREHRSNKVGVFIIKLHNLPPEGAPLSVTNKDIY